MNTLIDFVRLQVKVALDAEVAADAERKLKQTLKKAKWEAELAAELEYQRTSSRSKPLDSILHSRNSLLPPETPLV